MVDYSKWKDIEVSDDEDETHPNIDTPSLFRWRHQARIERMEEQERAKREFQQKKDNHNKKREEINKLKAEGKDVSQMEKDWEKVEKEIKDQEEELKKKERLTPWNVDTIGHDGFTKTVINKKDKADKKPELTEEEKAKRLREFTLANEKLMKQYGLLRKYDDSRRFLLDNPQLACEDTTSYLTIWCVNLALEDKIELMQHVSHQCIAMQFMLELARQLDRDPRSCISDFFSKIAHAEQLEYKRAFDDELRMFRERVLRRADEKIKEAEEEERKSRLGPGGLDPLEVLESLPDELKKCFESQDIPLLQETIKNLPPDQTVYHMKRCVDSGLWVPDARSKTKDGLLDPEDEEEGEEEEPKYEEIAGNQEKGATAGEEDSKKSK